MELPDFPSYDYLTYLNHKNKLILNDSSTTLTDIRDYLERNVSCNFIGGNFQDIIQSLTPETMLELSKCEVKADRIITMLKGLLNSVKDKPKNRHYFISVMDYVLNLSSTRGILLPFVIQSNVNDLFDTDRSSYDNKHNDDDEELNYFDAVGSTEEKKECEKLWISFSETMIELSKKYIIEMRNPCDTDENEEFGKLVEILLLFNQTTTAWKIFKECRQISFKASVKTITDKFQQKCNIKSKNPDQLSSVMQEILNGWESFTKIAVKSLTVDCRFITALFGDVSNAQDAILNFYLDFTAEQVKIILDKLTEWITGSTNDNSNKKSSLKSQGAVSNKGGVKINVVSDRKESSQSFNQVESGGSSSELKSQVSTMLVHSLNYKCISKLVASFARMEHQIYTVLNNQWSTPLGVNIDVAAGGANRKPKGVLKKIRRPSRMLSSDISDNRINSMSTPPSSLDAPYNQSTQNQFPSPVFEQDNTTFIPCIEWHTLAAPLFGPLSIALEFHLKRFCEALSFKTKPLPFFLYSHSQPTPCRVSESVQDYLRFLEDCVGTVIACSDSPIVSTSSTHHGSGTSCHGHTVGFTQPYSSLDSSGSSFNSTGNSPHSISSIFQSTLRAQIPQIYNDLKKSASSNLSLSDSVLVLADCAAFQVTWSLLNNIFKPKSEEIGVYFFEQRKQFSEFHKMFIRQITDRCFNELVSVVLQDSKSNFWGDLKEFHENTRVGYPIQAWNLYLERLWCLLSSNCAESIARELCADVLIKSLEFLVQRYASARPSRRRVPQARADMIAILHIVEQFIYKISDNADDLFGFGEELSRLKRVHFACMSLLQVIFVLTGPIDLLSRCYGNGFKKAVTKIDRNYSNCFWLNVIKPDKYQTFLSNDDGMKGLSIQESGLVTLESLLQTQQFDGRRVIEVICHKKMSLVTQILICLNNQLIELESASLASSATTVCGYDMTQDYQNVLDVFVRFYQVLIRISEPFSYFSSVIVSIIDSCNGWSIFHSDGQSKPPVWLGAIYQLLSSYVKSSSVKLLTAYVNDCLTNQHEGTTNRSSETGDCTRVNIDNMDSVLFPDGLLPCQCPLSLNDDDSDEEDNKNMEVSGSPTRESVIKECAESVCGAGLLIPLPLQVALSSIQEQLELKSIIVLGGHVILDSLLETLKKEALSGLKQTTSTDLFPEAETLLDRVWMDLVKYIEDTESIRATKDLIIQIYGKKLDNNDINPFQDLEEIRSAKTFFLGMQYSQITASDSGLEDVKFLDKFLRQNGQVLRQLFQMKSSTESDANALKSNTTDIKLDWSNLTTFNNATTKRSGSNTSIQTITQSPGPNSKMFRPFEVFCRVGRDEFNHKHYFKMDINWESLCKTDIGLSEICLETLLYNRWELEWAQKDEDGGLTDEDKTAALLLIDSYGLMSASDNIQKAADDNKK